MAGGRVGRAAVVESDGEGLLTGLTGYGAHLLSHSLKMVSRLGPDRRQILLRGATYQCLLGSPLFLAARGRGPEQERHQVGESGVGQVIKKALSGCPEGQGCKPGRHVARAGRGGSPGFQAAATFVTLLP